MIAVPAHGRRLHSAVRRVSLLCLFATALVTTPAQQATLGLASAASPLPSATSLVLATQAGVVTFDGTTLWLQPSGQPPQLLLQLPSFVFGSFLLPTDANHVLFGESSSHSLWHVPLQGPIPFAPLANLSFNYDATMLGAQAAVISARTGGFSSPDNELWHLDLVTGALQLLAVIPGASGPVAVDTLGDLYYATGFLGLPMPPATTQMMRFARAKVDAAVLHNRSLTLAHAQIFATGLDSCGDMAFDDDGDLLFVDWFNNRISEISDAATQPMLVPALLDYGTAPVFPTTVQFVHGNLGGVFEPYQPANGDLLVHETDYTAVYQLRRLRANQAADLTVAPPSPILTGPVDFVVSNAPPLGFGFFALALSAPGSTAPLAIPGLEAPLWWNNALTANAAIVPFAIDASGGAVLTMNHPGLSPAVPAVAQVAFVSQLGNLGATAALPLLISQ